MYVVVNSSFYIHLFKLIKIHKNRGGTKLKATNLIKLFTFNQNLLSLIEYKHDWIVQNCIV